MENIFPGKVICGLLESHHFLNLARSDKKKSSSEIKIIIKNIIIITLLSRIAIYWRHQLKKRDYFPRKKF